MIRIQKPTAPAILTTRGATAAADLHAQYNRGEKQFQFDGSIYAHDDVKAALWQAQRNKCAFCESKIRHIVYGDVEHFRPKGGCRQTPDGKMRVPGYYWLAYAWDNLYLSCPLCNQQFKRNCFPLRVQRHRARSHHDDIARESPLLIDPSESPEDHITFDGGRAVPKRRSLRGRITIEVLGLNRDALRDHRLGRRQHLLEMQRARGALLRSPPPLSATAWDIVRELDTLLQNAIADEAEYAAMARAMLG